MKREEVIEAIAGIALALWVLRIPQAVFDRMNGRQSSGPTFYIPSSKWW